MALTPSEKEDLVRMLKAILRDDALIKSRLMTTLTDTQQDALYDSLMAEQRGALETQKAMMDDVLAQMEAKRQQRLTREGR